MPNRRVVYTQAAHNSCGQFVLLQQKNCGHGLTYYTNCGHEVNKNHASCGQNQKKCNIQIADTNVTSYICTVMKQLKYSYHSMLKS